MTQAELGVRTGIGQAHISKLETGARPPSLLKIHQLCYAFSYTASYFYELLEGEVVARRSRCHKIAP